MMFTFQFIIACLLDMFFGDPRRIPHPVRGIGWLCWRYEALCRKLIANKYKAGTAAFFLVLLSTVLPLLIVLGVVRSFSPFLEGILAIIFLYTSIACRDLIAHSLVVYRALRNGGDLDVARRAVGMIVGRDTSALDRYGIARASVETVAENLVDGVLSPIFFAVLVSFIPAGDFLSPISMGVLGAYGYKAVNTMDSMFGYKNAQYLEFGRSAALIDDWFNFIPARLSVLFLAGATFILGFDTRGAIRIAWRDRLCHASPNGGHPEAAVAGALGIQLGGNSSYFGKIVEKPTMGDFCRGVQPVDILNTNRLVVVAAVLFVACGLLLRLFLID